MNITWNQTIAYKKHGHFRTGYDSISAFVFHTLIMHLYAAYVDLT